MKYLKVERLKKAFGSHEVLKDVSVSFEKGSVNAVCGESGCGKTTFLRLIAGLDRPDAGSIEVAGEAIDHLPPERRNVGLVFQNLALFPHLSVEKNISFALKGTWREKRRRVSELLDMVGIRGIEKRYPHEISGGQQQRVALARVLAGHPQILLLDEPFSNLDKTIKDKVRREILQVIKSLHLTTLLVTHHASDTFMISERAVVLQGGGVVQDGHPAELYRSPVSKYVSDFFGAGVAIPAKKDGSNVVTAFGSMPLEAAIDRREFYVFFRPENMKIGTDGLFKAIIKRKIFYGPHEILEVTSPDGSEYLRLEIEQSDFKTGDTIGFDLKRSDIKVFAGL